MAVTSFFELNGVRGALDALIIHRFAAFFISQVFKACVIIIFLNHKPESQ